MQQTLSFGEKEAATNPFPPGLEFLDDTTILLSFDNKTDAVQRDIYEQVISRMGHVPFHKEC
jgi:hypothetical protein